MRISVFIACDSANDSEPPGGGAEKDTWGTARGVEKVISRLGSHLSTYSFLSGFLWSLCETSG